ncbi:hypothetical protein L596_029106 [Steinernema carpocapsae]|uniref:RING-type domain-containing protein n=1 Tax=Steinernema carpocapsae TaxID=34508 RepID=A0A4U5LTN5_STECR|nr:hypothetical protein L596_029106 [Steinernema carpocapsae]
MENGPETLESCVSNKNIFATFLYNARLYMLACKARRLQVYSSDLTSCNAKLDFEQENVNLGWQYTRTILIGNNLFVAQIRSGKLICYNIDMLDKQASRIHVEEDVDKIAFFDSKVVFARKSTKTLLTFDLFEKTTEVVLDIADLEQSPSFECPICLERADTPKIFPVCGHSICSGCEEILAVVDLIQQTKTLACPECRKSIVLPLGENLPTNWALKKHVALKTFTSSETFDTLNCLTCKALLNKESAFHCDFCALENQTVDWVLCGACAINGHRGHMDHVKNAVFVSTSDKSKKLSSILCSFERLSMEKADTMKQLKENVEAFYTSADREMKAINKKLRELHRLSAVTENALNAESEKLENQRTLLYQKKAKFDEWKKTVLDGFSQLSSTSS